MNYTSINNEIGRLSYKHFTRVYWLETKFEWLKTVRNPAFSLPIILFPAVFYMFFGVLMNQGNTQAASYLLCTYGVFGVMGPALFSFGSGLAVERGRGWLDIKEASPMPPSAQLISRVFVCIGFSVVILLTLGVIALSIGGVSLSVSQSALLFTILLFGGLPFCLLGLFLGFLLKAESAPAIVNFIYLPMAFLSGLWIPISMLPDFLQSLANYLPPYHLSQLALKVVEQDMGGSVAIHLGMLALFGLLFAVLAQLVMKKKHN